MTQLWSQRTLQELRPERVRQQLGHRHRDHAAGCRNGVDEHVGRSELAQALAAPAARGSGRVAIGHHDDLDDRVLARHDHGRDRPRLGARTQRIGGVLHVAPHDHGARSGPDGRPHPVVRVRAVRPEMRPRRRRQQLRIRYCPTHHLARRLAHPPIIAPTTAPTTEKCLEMCTRCTNLRTFRSCRCRGRAGRRSA